MKQRHPYDHCSPARHSRKPQSSSWWILTLTTASPLHVNLQVADFQRCEWAFHQHQVGMKLHLFLHLLLLTTFQLYHLSPVLPSVFCLFIWCLTLYTSYCSVLLHTSKCCAIRFKMFSLFFVFFYVLFAWKYFKPITVQYYTANCVSWVPGLTLLDLKTNWTYQHALEAEFVHM